LVLNPAEHLAQARDSERFSSLTSLKLAITFYLATVDSLPTNPLGDDANCYVFTGAASGAKCGSRFIGSRTTTTINSRANNGTGWVPVDFISIPSGAPLSSVPVDPVQNDLYYYAYAGTNINKTFEINAKLESQKFTTQAATDGGNDPTIYETGTDLNL